jgi:hypothetical protein
VPQNLSQQAGKQSVDRAACFLDSERWVTALSVTPGAQSRPGCQQVSFAASSLCPDGTVMRPCHEESAHCLGLSTRRLPLAGLVLV